MTTAATNLGEHGVFVCLFTRNDSLGKLIAKRLRWRIEKRGAPLVVNLSGRQYAPDEIPVELMHARDESAVETFCDTFKVSTKTVPCIRIVSPLVIVHREAPREIEEIDKLLDLVLKLKEIERQAEQDPDGLAAWKRSIGALN